jgi:ferritin-like metal-binding protein YciE
LSGSKRSSSWWTRLRAKQLGHNDAVGLLEQSLDQEKHADQLLSEIAVSSANQKAPT